MTEDRFALSTLTEALETHGLEVVGRLLDASNAAYFGWAGPMSVIYKPVRGERPLWDFPTGCLAHRERASYLVDAAAGFGIVPPTVIHDGPAGPGSVQVWVTDPDLLIPSSDEDDDLEDDDDLDEDDDLDGEDEAHAVEDADDDGGPDGQVDDDAVDDDDPPLFLLLPPDEVEPPWLPVFTGEMPDGRPVVLTHADTEELRSVSVLDAVLNNSDRKGSHLLRGEDGRLWGIDHGVTFHEDPKLRTVLWGWAGERIPQTDLDRVRRLATALAGPDLRRELSELLTVAEIEALVARVDDLAGTGRHPVPHPGWPPVPWPAL